MRDVNQVVDLAFDQTSLKLLNLDRTTLSGYVQTNLKKYAATRIMPNLPERVPVVLFPPGENIHLYRDGRSISACHVPCDFFSELDVARTMVDDHLISGYDKVFLQLLRDYNNDQHFAFEKKIRG
jgi:hypothetical protein